MLDERAMSATPPGWVLVPILIGFVVACGLLFRAHAFPLLAEQDGIVYLQMAVSPGSELHAFHGPGYPLAIRGVMRLGPEPFVAAKLVSLASGVLFVAATWWLATSVLAPGEALAAAAIAAVTPLVLTSSVTVMSDVLGAALFLASLAVLLGFGAGAWWAALLAGALGGLAYLTRHVYVIALAAPVLLWLARRGRRVRGLVASLGPFVGGFVVVTLPWLALVSAQHGNPLWSRHHVNLAFKAYLADGGQNAFQQAREFAGWWDVVRFDPLRLVRSWAWTFLGFPLRMVTPIVGGGMLAAAGLLTWVPRMTAPRTTMLAMTALYGAVVSLAVPKDRYVLPALPLAVCLIAGGLGALAAGIRAIAPSRRLEKLPLGAAAVALALALLLSADLRDGRAWFADEALEYRDAAAQLAARAPAAASLLAGPRHLAFFSGTRPIGFMDEPARMHDATLADLPARLARVRPTYVAFDDRYVSVRLPRFRDLVDPRLNPYPELLRPVIVVDRPRRVVIYEYAATR